MSNTTSAINSEVPPVYQVKIKPEGAKRSRAIELTDEQILERAREIMRDREQQRKAATAFTEPAKVKQYLTDFYMGMEREVFSVIFLDSQHRFISTQELFKGTINAAAVYPREILKAALKENAAAVILAHNHPSGEAEPSRADTRVTDRIKEALTHLDISLLDHIVVGFDVTEAVSFAERGLL